MTGSLQSLKFPRTLRESDRQTFLPNVSDRSEAPRMNFFEHIFRISPDGGNGTVEAACLLLLFTVPVVYAAARWLMRRRPKHATL
jgi:hypothetical protein